ncbi:MAG: dihydroorotate dehydrogenase [Phycisphaerales bacterium]
MAVLTTNLAGVELRSPIIGAAGTCGYVDELADAVSLDSFGAITTKSITRDERRGNPTWRILDMPAGMLNAIGLANVGLDRFLAEKLPRAAALPTVLIGSVAGGSIEEYVMIAAAMDASQLLPIIELNVSCPNTADGLMFGEHVPSLKNLIHEVRQVVTHSKLFVKLSPGVGSLIPFAEAAIAAGVDGLTLVNTFPAMSFDVEMRQPRLSVGSGGYSGPAVHPMVVKMICDVHLAVAGPAEIPIIGVGGVMNWRAAAEFILAGATACGIGTGLFANPRLPARISRGLESWVRRQGCTSVMELRGMGASHS